MIESGIDPRMPPKHNVVHDYILGRKIGQGSFGTIHMAMHYRTKHPAAVKVLSKRKLQESIFGNVIVFNETVLARLVDHPSILDCFDTAITGSEIFQFMRYAEGGNLLDRLRKSPIELSQSSRIVDQLLSAVEYLHSYGICHRDIKLENILLIKNGMVKLGDLGCASVTTDGNVRGRRGSDGYIAPEVTQMESYNGFKADMWSLGVVLYALFARCLPFGNGFRPNLSLIPERFRALVQSLLSSDPNERPNACQARRWLSNTVAVKEPLSALHAQIHCGESLMTVSKLSQIIQTPLCKLKGRLESDVINREKVLYLLLSRKMQQEGTALRTVLKNNSNPSQEEKVYGHRTEYLKADASLVYAKIHEYLLRQKCCMSSPVSSNMKVIQKKDGCPIALSMYLNDMDDGRSALSLRSSGEADTLAMSIIKHVTELFA